MRSQARSVSTGLKEQRFDAVASAGIGAEAHDCEPAQRFEA
jgi:hypothetical protein